MDVRAVDTTGLAAKRLELEKVRPVTQKSQAFNLADEAATAEAVAAVNGNPDRQKSPKDMEEEFAETAKQHSDDSSGYTFDAEDGQQDDDNPDTGHGEHHILDVKV